MATQARIALEPRRPRRRARPRARARRVVPRRARAGDRARPRSVLTQRVDALLDYGLLAEDGVGVSTGGRAPRLLRFRADAGYLLVADLGATSTDVALADLAGEILVHRQEASDIAAGPDAVLARVEELFDECVARGRRHRLALGHRHRRPRPGRVRVGPAGLAADHAGLGRLRRARALRASAACPVWVDNDVNVMALGELTAGCGRGVDDFVFVKIGTGIGAGIVVDGRIHRGAKGSAGDIGHIHVQAGREVTCRCGMSGCLEAFAGGAALARDAEAAAREGRSEILRALLDEKGFLDAADVAVAVEARRPVEHRADHRGGTPDRADADRDRQLLQSRR